ncbi:VanZ family protein [Aliagarivorans taiwanensis]|uniref:VanZ family protein n=1 Tax=Aliagarivorans taiwanensis TaxID=561966 RepID=UPI000410F6ED|nr:VanZ family protein [Aliagarivorans taiwanensis]
MTALLRLLCLLFCVLLALGDLSKSFGWFLDELHYLEVLLGGDKVLHLGCATLSTVAVLLFVDSFRVNSDPSRILLVLVFWGGVVSLVELHQMFVPTRQFSWGDLAANYLGVCLGLACWLVIKAITDVLASPRQVDELR